MSLEVSIVLIIAAGIGGYFLGRSRKATTVAATSSAEASPGDFSRRSEKYTMTRSVSLVCYDCDENKAVVNVTNAVGSLALYGWDNSTGASPGPGPPSGSKIVTCTNGQMTITGVPHQNGATKILLQVWGIDLFIDQEIDCDSNSMDCSSGSSRQTQAFYTRGTQSSVLP